MGDRHAPPSHVDLALALLMMATGLAVFAASVMSLLPVLVVVPFALLLGRTVRRAARVVAGRATTAELPAMSALRSPVAALRLSFDLNRNDRWQRPPTEAA